MTKMHELYAHGQSVWLDYIRRSLLTTGDLDSLIADGLRGMTSNPAIFEKAIAHSDDYDQQLQELVAESNLSTLEIYETLAVQDIQGAADALFTVYQSSGGEDGYISLEANPHLANDAKGTIAEVHRLRALVNRDNIMYKIPATPAGIQAVEALIAEGYNINITLMFSMKHYEDVAFAYINGLEKLVAQGGDVSKVSSVASFFISRVDSLLDPRIEQTGKTELLGKIGIANSKAVYQRFKEIFSGERWQKLADLGAKVQRPLWASTSTKNPAFPDTLYVDTLIGQHTVNTLPPETLEAFLDHGTVASTIEQDLDATYAQLNALAAAGIDLLAVGEELQADGIAKFTKPFDSMLSAIETKVVALKA